MAVSKRRKVRSKKSAERAVALVGGRQVAFGGWTAWGMFTLAILMEVKYEEPI